MMWPVFLSVLLVLASAADDDYNNYNGPSEADVITLDADSLEPTIYESEDPWLLDLHAPWCGHCKSLRPEWAQLATRLRGKAKVAKLDASIYRKFDQVYDLKGYPHVVYIPGGRKSKSIFESYDGTRMVGAMEEWALERIQKGRGFLVEKLTSEAKWNELCSGIGASVCVVVFLPHLLDSSQEERQVYIEIVKSVSNNFRDKPVSFMWAQAGDHKELEESFSMSSGYPISLLVNPNKKFYSIMRSAFSEENFESWLKELLQSRRASKLLSKYSNKLVFGEVPEDISEFSTSQTPANDQGDNFAQEL